MNMEAPTETVTVSWSALDAQAMLDACTLADRHLFNAVEHASLLAHAIREGAIDMRLGQTNMPPYADTQSVTDTLLGLFETRTTLHGIRASLEAALEEV